MVELTTSTLYPIHDVEEASLARITLNPQNESGGKSRKSKSANAPGAGPMVLLAENQDVRDCWAESLMMACTTPVLPPTTTASSSAFVNVHSDEFWEGNPGAFFHQNAGAFANAYSSFSSDYVFRQAMLSGFSLPTGVFPADVSPLLSSSIETLVSNQKINYLARERPILYCYTGQKEFLSSAARAFRRVSSDALSRCVIITNRRIIRVKGTAVQVDYEFSSLSKLIFLSSRKVINRLHATSTLLEKIVADELSYETQPLWLRTIRATTSIPSNVTSLFKFHNRRDQRSDQRFEAVTTEEKKGGGKDNATEQVRYTQNGSFEPFLVFLCLLCFLCFLRFLRLLRLLRLSHLFLPYFLSFLLPFFIDLFSHPLALFRTRLSLSPSSKTGLALPWC